MQGRGDVADCISCGVRIERSGGRLLMGDGGKNRVEEVDAAELCRRIDAHGGPITRATKEDGTLAYAARALVSWRRSEEAVRYRGALRGFSETMGPTAPGTISVDAETVAVEAETAPAAERRRTSSRWRLVDLRAVQAASSSLQLSLPGDRLVQLRFLDDSSRRWETLMRQLIADAWARAGKGRVVEFQPRIVVRQSRGGRPAARGARTLSGATRPRFPWYAFFGYVVRSVGRLLTRPRVTGLSNIPATGPFFLVANHLSILDPLLVQGFCPRRVHAFTKSTQFSAGRFSRWVLPRVGAIPTRRYRVDPQVVRTALRVLESGDGVCIYPEGERSWDGRLQPFRGGTLRLILKAGVPVIPCGISGSYAAWPRWSRRPSRNRERVFLRYGEPIRFGVHHPRAERESALAAADAQLRDALVGLGAPAADGPRA